MWPENCRGNSPRHPPSSTPDGRPFEGGHTEELDVNSAAAPLSTRPAELSTARASSAADDGAGNSTIPSPSGRRKQDLPSAASRQTSAGQVAVPFRDDFACLAGETQSKQYWKRPKAKGKKSEPKGGRKPSTAAADCSSPQHRKSISTAPVCAVPVSQDSSCEGRPASTSATNKADDCGKGSEQQLSPPLDAEQVAAGFCRDEAKIEKKSQNRKQVGGQKQGNRMHRPSVAPVLLVTDADVTSRRQSEMSRPEKECEEVVSPSGSDHKPGAQCKDGPSRKLGIAPGESNLSDRRPSKDGAAKTRKKRPSIHRSNTISKDFFGGSEESTDNSVYETNKHLDRLAEISPEFSQLVLVKKQSLRKHSLRDHSGTKDNLFPSSRSELRSSSDKPRASICQPETLAETRNQGTKGLGVFFQRSRRESHHADVKGGTVIEQEKPFAESGSAKRTSSDIACGQPARSVDGPHVAVDTGRPQAREDDKRRNEVSLEARSSTLPHKVDSTVERKQQGMNVLASASNEKSSTPDEKQEVTEEGVQSTFMFSPELSDDRKTSEYSDASPQHVASTPVRNRQLDSHSDVAAVGRNAEPNHTKAGVTELFNRSPLPNGTPQSSDVDSTPPADTSGPPEKSLGANADRATWQLEAVSIGCPEQAPVATSEHEQMLTSQSASPTVMREPSETGGIAKARALDTPICTRVNDQPEIVSECSPTIQDRSDKSPDECLVFDLRVTHSVGTPSVGDRCKATESDVKVTADKLEPSSADYVGTSLIILEFPGQDPGGEIDTSSKGNAPSVCPASKDSPDDACNALEAEVKLMMGMDAGKPPAKADISMEDFQALTEGDDLAMRNLAMSSGIGALQSENAVGQIPHAPAAEHSAEYPATEGSGTIMNEPKHADQLVFQHAHEVAVNPPTSTNAGSSRSHQLSQEGTDAAAADLAVVPPQGSPLAQCAEASAAKSVLPKTRSSPKRPRHGSDGAARPSRSEGMTRHKRKKAHSFSILGRVKERSLSICPPSASGTATGSRTPVHKDDVDDSAALFGVKTSKSMSERDLWQELSGMLTQPVSVGVSVPALGEVVVLVDEHTSPHDQLNHVLPSGSYTNIQELDIVRDKMPVITNDSTR